MQRNDAICEDQVDLALSVERRYQGCTSNGGAGSFIGSLTYFTSINHARRHMGRRLVNVTRAPSLNAVCGQVSGYLARWGAASPSGTALQSRKGVCGQVWRQFGHISQRGGSAISKATRRHDEALAAQGICKSGSREDRSAFREGSCRRRTRRRVCRQRRRPKSQSDVE